MRFLNKHLEALATAALVLFTLGVVGCAGNGKDFDRSTTYTAEAVYLNEPNSVSILMRKDDNSLTVKKFYCQELIFKDDITLAEVHPWIGVDEQKELGSWVITKIFVHVHSVQEIQPGHWDHGKFGNGQNQKVE